MKLDLDSHVPIFEQIARGIRQEIARGIYRPGEGLPSIRTLAVELRVNHNTVQKAYGVLERDGLIRQRRGIGMFVTTAAVDAATEEVTEGARRALEAAVRRCASAGLDAGAIHEAVDEVLEEAGADLRPRRPTS